MKIFQDLMLLKKVGDWWKTKSSNFFFWN